MTASQTGFMRDQGLRLIDNGWPIIPIAPGTKRPGAYIKKRWVAYSDWSRHCDRPTSAMEAGIWAGWPGCGVGIPCGAVVGIDIDVLEPGLAERLEGLAFEILGPTPLVRIGRAPKRMLVYRAEAPFCGWKPHPVEVYGRGQQLVAFALHPETGQPYYWVDGDPSDTALADLPGADEARCRAFTEAADRIIPDRMKEARQGRTFDGRYGTSLLGLEGTLGAAKSALEAMPNADLHWQDWFDVAASLRGALGDEGRELFFDWSAQSGKHDDRETERVWRSLKNPRKGAGSLYHMAGAKGWSPPAHLILNGNLAGIVASMPGHDPADPPLPPDTSRDEARAAAREVEPFHDIGGLLGELVRWTTATARRPQPMLALGAALAAVGTLAGRRYRTESDLRSNIYVLGIADSGGGKEHARACVKKAFYAAGLDDWLGGNRIASGQAVLSALIRHPAILFQLDEFGQFLKQATGPRASTHRAEIWSSFTELYTSANGVFSGTEYADQKERPRRDVAEPCLCLHAVTAPGPLWETLQSGALSDGSLARFLLFRAQEDYPDEADALPEEAPEPVILGLQMVAAGVDRPSCGNLTALMAPNASPDPYTVPSDDEARAMFKALALEQTVRLRQAAGGSRAAIIARWGEQARKLALIRAVADDPGAPVIDADRAAWGIRLAEHCMGTLLDEAEKHIADNDTEGKVKRVMRLVEKAGRITMGEMHKRTRFLTRRERIEIIEGLKESGEVEVRTLENNRARPTLLIVWKGTR